MRLAMLATIPLLAISNTAARAALSRLADSKVVAEPNVVTVVAHDFALDIPASIPAGLTTFRLLNRGKQMHHMSVVRLDEGKTAADGMAALIKVGRGVRPTWMHPVGGPNAPMPGGESQATLVLEPGNYFAYCEVPGPDPAPHFMKGMMKGFVVTAPAHAAVLPSTALSIRLTDYDFVIPRAITRGRHSITVTNAATLSHMLVLHRFASGYAAGKGTKEFLAWAHDPKGLPAPGEAAGGVTEMPPGATVVINEDFTPGTYVLICFVPDDKDGKPHFMHGMQKEIIVQ